MNRVHKFSKYETKVGREHFVVGAAAAAVVVAVLGRHRRRRQTRETERRTLSSFISFLFLFDVFCSFFFQTLPSFSLSITFFSYYLILSISLSFYSLPLSLSSFFC